MLAWVGLNRGSRMSARNFCLSLISPSHSVLTKRLETSASKAAESRLTWASFHRRSRTASLLSRGSACCADAVAAKARTKQQMMVRFITFHVRHIPTCRRAHEENSSARQPTATKITFRGLRTSRTQVAVEAGGWKRKPLIINPMRPGSEQEVEVRKAPAT